MLLVLQDVGYAEPFSAHQLLYPGGEDTRALLLELLSMLPPEGVSRSACVDTLFGGGWFRFEESLQKSVAVTAVLLKAGVEMWTICIDRLECSSDACGHLIGLTLLQVM